MQKGKKLITMVLVQMILAVSLLTVGCGKINTSEKENKKTVSFTGIQTELALSLEDVQEYDFKSGVFATDEDGTLYEFSVDMSNADFTKPGQYEIHYVYGELAETVVVKVYGEPTITNDAITLTYAEASNILTDSSPLNGKITCKDSFGKKLTFTVVDISRINGEIQTGASNLTIKAMDDVGNIVEKAIDIIVEAPLIETIDKEAMVDLGDAIYTFACEQTQLLSVYLNETEVGASCYVYNNGYVMLLPSFFTFCEVGDSVVTINFTDYTVRLQLTVTDEAEAKFFVNGEINAIYGLGDEVVLPKAIKAETSAQNLEFRYFLKTSDGVTVKEEMAFYDSFVCETDETEYTYFIEIYKNEELIETLTQNFVCSTKKYLSQNMASQMFLNSWERNNSTTTITIEDNVEDTEGTAKDALKYYNATAKGNNVDNLVKFFWLSPNMISRAKANGFTTFGFYYLTGSEPEGEQYSASLSIYQYNKDGNKTKGNFLLFKNKANLKWTKFEADLADIEDGNTLLISPYGTTIYIADAYFKIVEKADPMKLNYDGNFATEEYATAWGYSGVTDTTVYNQIVNGKDGAMKVTSSGSSWYTGHTIFLNADIIAQAKAQGKTHLTFSWTSDNAVGVYEYSGSGTFNSEGKSHFAYKTNNGAWNSVEVDLSKIAEGKALCISMVNSTYVALKDVYFVEKLNPANLDYSGNFATEAYAGAWQVYTGGATSTIEYGQTVNEKTNVLKVSATGSAWDKGYAVFLSADIIAAAKAKGYTTLTFNVLADKELRGVVYAGEGTIKYSNVETAFKLNDGGVAGWQSNGVWNQRTIDLSKIPEGYGMAICMYNSSYVALENVYFK